MDPVTAAVLILFVLVALLLAAGAGLYRRVRELELATYRGVGVHVGTGGERSAGIGRPGATTIAVKINRRCPVCEDVLLAVGKLAADLPDGVGFTVVSDDPAFDKELPASVQVIRDPQVWRSISVPYVPALLVVDEQGVVLHTTPAGSGEIVSETVERVIARRKEAKL
ncbi:hypothetical protein AB0B45_03500 [Nonomuraea sp. NPDC049152]|uniref:TlpA family protein disulfide reductase n=1 Tax=Nonomuraea sp. NPDC049152 TaxID=3154350 RepID=UPI0033DB80A7